MASQQTQGMTGGPMSAGPRPAPTPRPGDWYCPNPACMNLNYASRLVCHKCSTPPTFNNPQLQQHILSLAAWGLGAPGNGFGGPGNGFPGGPPMGLPFMPPTGKGTTRPGDWLCPACNNHNYASRTACNKCQANKPPNPAAPAPVPQNPYEALFSAAYTLPQAGGGAGGKMRPGDWMCTGCSNHNYASRQKCNRCQTDRPAELGMGAQPY